MTSSVIGDPTERNAWRTMYSHTGAFPAFSAFSQRHSFTEDSASAFTCATVTANDGDHATDSLPEMTFGRTVWVERKPAAYLHAIRARVGWIPNVRISARQCQSSVAAGYPSRSVAAGKHEKCQYQFENEAPVTEAVICIERDLPL